MACGSGGTRCEDKFEVFVGLMWEEFVFVDGREIMRNCGGGSN